jgi:2-polyprenyl-6-methoxyphenol hydroxylase-like FAD-dependent oxidoreductase
MQSLRTTCCVAGGGPAGMMLGYLLARMGVEVVVLEKHADFFRDFRGDTVHPSTLEVMYELGLLEEFLKLPHQELTSVGARVGDFALQAANFSHLPTHCKFVGLMPQWDFLNFLSDRAKRFPRFQLRMEHEAVNVTRAGRTIAGVEARTPEGPVQIQADLVVACDGRHSTIRQAAGLEVQEFGVPIDVLWFRISRKSGDPEQVLGNINYGRALILINRGDYFQAGLIIPKGSFEQTKRDALDSFRETIARIAPYLRDRVSELQSWDQIKLLTVQINRLRKWHRPGLLCIGDAAHAMSPAGGVGINLAIQDAVATANLLAEPLREGRVTEALLARVQQRREFPTRATQMLQVNAHKLFERVFENGDRPLKAPWQLRAVTQVPGLQRVMGHVVGIGVRPEHVAGAVRRTRRQEWSVKRAAVEVGAAVGAVVATLRALGSGLDLRLRILRPHPLHELLGRRHG